MHLALDKNGNLGRMVKNKRMLGADNSDVGVAVVAPAVAVKPHKNHVLSSRRIAQDHVDAQNSARVAQAKRMQHLARRNAQIFAHRTAAAMGAREAAIMEKQKPKDRDNETLKNYFFQQAQRGETANVNRSLNATGPRKNGAMGTLPMDFDQLESMPDTAAATGSTQDQYIHGGFSRADFRHEEMIGSPLTNNGQFGPSTDWDLYIARHELNNSMPVNAPGVLHPGDLGDTGMIVGGTMLGRYDGKVIPLHRGMLSGRRRSLPRFSGFGDDGVDLTDDSYTTIEDAPQDDPSLADSAAVPVTDSSPGFFSNLLTSVTGGLSSGAGTAASKLASNALAPTSTATQNQQLLRTAALSSADPVTKFAAQVGAPVWTIYAGMGLILAGGLYVLSRK